MAKKINIKLVDQSTLKFEINENAEKGDYFILSEIEQISFDEITRKIEEKKNVVLKDIWEKNKQSVISSSEEFVQLNGELNKLRNEIIQLNSQKESIARETELKVNSQFEKDKINLENEIANLKKEQLENSEKARLILEAEVAKKEKMVRDEFEDKAKSIEKELIETRSKLDLLNNSKQLEIDNKKLETEKAVENKYREILEEKENAIRELENRRNLLNIKELGEGLENFMQTEASNNLSLPHSKFFKSNDVIDGTKPDFIFEVLNKDGARLTSVTIEAKSETLNAKSKKKNDDHIEKLDSDRKKQGSEYAILVTELEKDDGFIFKKVGEYENMYMVRPRYFVPLLQLIYNVAQKGNEINDLQIDFKEKQLILDEFESFKNDVIEVTLSKISKNIEDIQSQANKAINANTEIIDKSRIMSNHMATLENKFMNFKIQKLIDKIEK